jgi:hypothetical protein
MARSTQDRPDRKAELPREIVCLIEAPTERSPPRQGNRDERVGAVEHLVAGLAHQATQWRRERPPALVLECVDDVSKRSVVASGAPGHPDERRVPAASRAERIEGVEPWQRVTAARAAGRGQPCDRAPAAFARRAVEGPIERFAAGHTLRRQQHADHGI